MKQEPKKEKVQGKCGQCVKLNQYNECMHYGHILRKNKQSCMGFGFVKKEGKQPAPKEEVRMNRERELREILRKIKVIYEGQWKLSEKSIEYRLKQITQLYEREGK